MFKIKISLLLMFAFSLSASSQIKLNIGLGGNVPAGAVAGFEIEKFFTDKFSSPLRTDVSFFLTKDYNALTIDLHKGFRKYFGFGLFVEQYVGLGAIASFYKVQSIWYYDNYGNNTRFKDGANWGIMPSVSLGIGYDLMHKKEKAHMIWVRPKLYWNMGFRGLNLPYTALQAGYTMNIK